MTIRHHQLPGNTRRDFIQTQEQCIGISRQQPLLDPISPFGIKNFVEESGASLGDEQARFCMEGLNRFGGIFAERRRSVA